MKLKFLCSTHRAHLLNDPSRAVMFWQSGFDTAQMFCDSQAWMEALPHIGCAYETADIILITKVTDAKACFEMFTSSTVSLAFTLLKLGRTEDAGDVYWSAIQRLEGELAMGNANYYDLMQNLGFLYECVDQVMSQFRIRHKDAMNWSSLSHRVVH
ncbi:MAG: hypothetical protein P8O06_06785 [Porticoccaceae bacterium]|nr:hypothetical protein [Porticoccaceae bacterium]